MNRLYRYRFAGLMLIGLLGCMPKPLPIKVGDPAWGVQVTWHGQSCFTLKDQIGRTIVIDPFDETVGYGWLRLRADAILVTHQHFDHNYVRGVRSRSKNLEIVESTGPHRVAGGMDITGILSYHDNYQGQINGPNIIYKFNMGGLDFVHLGDLGQEGLTPDQFAAIGKTDVLFVPVGGVTTLDAELAYRASRALGAKVVIPMHYGNIRFYKLDEVSNFLELFEENDVMDLHESTTRFRRSDLPERQTVYVFEPTANN